MYNIYPTLLDSFNYFYNFPSIEKEAELLDKINRVKHEMTNQAQLGVAFENLINSILKGANFTNTYDGFTFNESVIKEVVLNLEGYEVQKYVSQNFNINGYDVKLFGFVDYIKQPSLVDLKTTSKYKIGKYKFYSQRHIYSMCLDGITKFTFLVTDFEGVMKEPYFISKRESMKYLNESIPKFIEFIESNREKITDTKIFGIDSAPSKLTLHDGNITIHEIIKH